jgi:hypothetical protein
MFPYWSAPPSLLRVWADSRDPVPVPDDKIHFSSLAVRAGEELGSILSRIGCYARALLSSHAADRPLRAC